MKISHVMHNHIHSTICGLGRQPASLLHAMLMQYMESSLFIVLRCFESICNSLRDIGFAMVQPKAAEAEVGAVF